WRLGARLGLGRLILVFLSYVDVPTCAAAFFFDFGEIRAFVPIGFGVIVVGNGVKTRAFGLASCNRGIGHTHDGRRVSATAEFCKDRPIGTEFSFHRLCNDGTKGLLVLGVSAVADILARMEMLILADSMASRPPHHPRGRWHW